MKFKAKLREANLPKVDKVMHCVVQSVEKQSDLYPPDGYPQRTAEITLCLFGDELDGVDFTIDVEVIE